MVIIAKNK